MYRAVTFAVLRRGVDPHDVDAVEDVAMSIELDIRDVDGATQVVVDGDDATAEIRGREVTETVSAVAANSAVRAEMVERQRGGSPNTAVAWSKGVTSARSCSRTPT